MTTNEPAAGLCRGYRFGVPGMRDRTGEPRMSTAREILAALLDWIFEWVIPAIGILLAVVAVIAAIVVPLRYIGHAVDYGSCESFGRQTGRTVKFVDYTWITWDCVTPAQDGKWISTDYLRDIPE